MLDVLQQKCTFKGRGIPILAELETHRGELESLWQSMLNHQLPSLPPYDTFWNELPAFFDWLAGGQTPIIPAAYAISAGETILRERSLRLPVSGRAQAFVEVIRFAAANRLLVELDYQGSTRRIEAYSLRRTSDGNIVLHAFNADRAEHRSYRVDRISGARVTNTTFVPRYEIELSPEGPVRVAESARRTQSSSPKPPVGRARNRSSGQLTYVYQCPMCQKKFRRAKPDSRLNAHKNTWGGQCSGRTGYLVDAVY
jgi:hypothetical protein